MNDNSLSKTLSRLLFERNIRPTELARITQVPQPTIQRIVAGTTLQPHISSLEPIAHYFAISVEQLRGLKPIPWLQPSPELTLSATPLLNWDQVTAWAEGKLLPEQAQECIMTDARVSEQAFALILKDASMEPVFSIGTTLIIDPKKPAHDRRYAIIKLAQHSEALFRQLIADGNRYYLKSLSPELNHSQPPYLNEQDQICGILVQAKINFDA